MMEVSLASRHLEYGDELSLVFFSVLLPFPSHTELAGLSSPFFHEIRSRYLLEERDYPVAPLTHLAVLCFEFATFRLETGCNIHCCNAQSFPE